MKKVIILSVLVVLVSCAVQFSSVQKINNTEFCNINTAILGISADYKMNMSTSNDVKFFLKEINTGEIIEPQKRDAINNNFYFSVPPGICKIALITIAQPPVSKSIIFNDSTNEVIKFLGKPKPFPTVGAGRCSVGLSYTFTILTGDKSLVYDDQFSVPIRIEPNYAYYLGEYKFEGYIKSVINDMPNIRVMKINPINKDKLKSFRTISEQAFHNSDLTVDTTANLFKVSFMDLSKTNAKSN